MFHILQKYLFCSLFFFLNPSVSLSFPLVRFSFISVYDFTEILSENTILRFVLLCFQKHFFKYSTTRNDNIILKPNNKTLDYYNLFKKNNNIRKKDGI